VVPITYVAYRIFTSFLPKKQQEDHEEEEEQYLLPVGLVNEGATCYLNSLLQTLFHIPFFRSVVYKMKPQNAMTVALQRVFYDLQFHGGSCASAKKLTKAFGWTDEDVFVQHDVQELARKLIDGLESRLSGSKNAQQLQRLFQGKTKTMVKCLNVPYESSREETFMDLQLSVLGHRNLYDAFRDYIKPEKLEGENKYHAEQYGYQEALRSTIFVSLPPVLFIHLKRFEYNPMAQSQYKINQRFEFPDMLDLMYFVQDEEERKDCIYTLHSVLVHRGNIGSGHYYAFINTASADDSTKQWYQFNDANVTPSSEREVIEHGFGGSESGASAYMLVYIKTSYLKDVLAPVREQDIPAKLIERFEKEGSSRCSIL
jgi:ubiquitin carboxyl-terminal hydrolase 7